MKKFLISFIVLSFFTIASFYLGCFLLSKKITEKKQSLIQKTEEKAPSPSPKKEAVYVKDIGAIREKFISEGKDFIEANLGDMKIKIYQKGQILKEFPIFTKGNPERWGGTSLGVYKILSKTKLAFSMIASSYMPWSLHVYGKYYIHGDNYYLGRGVDTSPITGGCLRLKNPDAKDVYELTAAETPTLVTDKGFENDGYQYSEVGNTKEFPELFSKNYLVADLGSGFVFAEKSSDQKVPIASLTKLMTAIIIAENVDLRKYITITQSMLEPLRSTKGLEAGKSFTAVDLFWPLLIESSNDAAEALSRFKGREKTIAMMNEKAKAILMENTTYIDPHGLSFENISTAQDLFNLARYILNSRPMLLKISKGEEVWTFGFPITFKDLENKNIFFEDPNFIGGKTNYMDASQAAGLFIFKFSKKDGAERKVAIILSGSESSEGPETGLKKDTEQTLNWLRENYFKDI